MREMSPGLLEIIRWDYLRVFAETGVSLEWAERRAREPADQCPLPAGLEHLRLAPSPIQGLGLFTHQAIAAGDTLGPARIACMRTPLGRYANHSPWPNAEFRLLASGDVDSVALCDIPAGAEILNDYRQGARLWGAVFDLAEVACTLQQRQERLRALDYLEDQSAWVKSAGRRALRD